MLTPLAGLCELYSIPAYSTESVNDHIASASLGNVFGNRFGRDGEPARVVQQQRKCVVLRQEELTLVPVCCT